MWFLLLAVWSAHSYQSQNTSTPQQLAAVSSLMSVYSRGAWYGDMGWWNQANALEAMVNYMEWTNDQGYLGVLAEVFAAQPNDSITTAEYFDDVQWWGLAWLRAYELTSDVDYVARAELVWTYVQTEAWDNVCGGGVWWSTARGYKNAITNELFLQLTSRLYALTGNSTYLMWASKEWSWFKNSGMLNAQWLVNDGLTLLANGSCVNNGGQTWTYNQGVILGGLASMYLITDDSSYVDIAAAIANATIQTLIYPNGILREPCEAPGSSCGADGRQFKGIFMRYVGYLLLRVPTLARNVALSPFSAANGVSIWQNDRTNAGSLTQFGLVWIGPFDQVSAISDGSVLDAFNTAMALSPNA